MSWMSSRVVRTIRNDRLGDASTSPSWTSFSRASRTGIVLTPRLDANSSWVRRCSGLRSPIRIMSRRVSAASSLGERRRMGLGVRPKSPTGSLTLMRPISHVPFCAPPCAYVEYAQSGVPHPTKPTGFAGTPRRRLLGSGPPDRQISRSGFRPHPWLPGSCAFALAAAVGAGRLAPLQLGCSRHLPVLWRRPEFCEGPYGSRSRCREGRGADRGHPPLYGPGGGRRERRKSGRQLAPAGLEVAPWDHHVDKADLASPAGCERLPAAQE